ncbi:HTH_48 domain-containing protein [Trichonephila clavipes]|nr:HTH_48 domain-containing protein [Trichonephila clavipes]
MVFSHNRILQIADGARRYGKHAKNSRSIPRRSLIKTSLFVSPPVTCAGTKPTFALHRMSQLFLGSWDEKDLRQTRAESFNGRLEISAYWKLHHDNEPYHTFFVVTEHLSKNGIVTIPQPSYCPDLALADFFLFSKGKTALKGRHHGTLDDVKRACT